LRGFIGKDGYIMIMSKIIIDYIFNILLIITGFR